jgi:hypothetical protein
VYGKLPLVRTNGGFVKIQVPVNAADEIRVPPLETHLSDEAGNQFLAILDCSAGGVSWPETLALYGPGPRLLGHINLGSVPKVPASEHADATKLKMTAAGDVKLTWISYEGANFEKRTWQAHVVFRAGELKLSGVKLIKGPVNRYPKF